MSERPNKYAISLSELVGSAQVPAEDQVPAKSVPARDLPYGMAASDGAYAMYLHDDTGRLFSPGGYGGGGDADGGSGDGGAGGGGD